MTEETTPIKETELRIVKFHNREPKNEAGYRLKLEEEYPLKSFLMEPVSEANRKLNHHRPQERLKEEGRRHIRTKIQAKAYLRQRGYKFNAKYGYYQNKQQEKAWLYPLRDTREAAVTFGQGKNGFSNIEEIKTTDYRPIGYLVSFQQEGHATSHTPVYNTFFEKSGRYQY